MRLAVGADEIGSEFLDRLLEAALGDGAGYVLDDFRARVQETGYAPVAAAVGEAVSCGDAKRGIVVCGTGVGVCIAANKVHGIRAAVCHDVYSVERSVLSNNCQVACFGARVIGVEAAARLLVLWLGLTFDPHTASQPKLDELRAIEDYERSRP